MRRALAAIAFALALCGSLRADVFIPIGGSAGGGGSGELMADRLQTTYTATQCVLLTETNGATASCTTGTVGLVRRYVAKATTLTGWEVRLHDAVTSTTGCTFTLVTNLGDVATTTKPMLGDTAVGSRTLLDTDGDTYYEAISVSLAAGGWFSMRVDNEATGSAGSDGTCAGAANVDTMWNVYGR